VSLPDSSSDANANSESLYREDVLRNLPRNYVGHVLHGLLGQTGFRLINAPTFIPTYLFLLSGSDLAVGVGRGLQYLGMALSPVLGATLIEHRRRVLPAGFLVGGLMRLQVLGIALAGFLLPSSWALAAVCLFLGLFGFFLGMQGVIFGYLLSKVIPVEKRGFLLGLRNSLAGITAIAVAWFSGSYLVDANALGNGYSATFLLAFVLTSLGLCMLLIVREPQPPQVRPRARLAERMRDLPDLLRGDRQFAAFFVSRALGSMGRMAVPFYVLYASNRVEISGAQLGELTAGYLLAQSGVNLAWGWIADRSGFRLVFLLSLVLWILSAVVLMLSAEFFMLLLVFVGLGAGLGGFMMASQNMTLEFGSQEDLPMRIALVNTGGELVGAVGPVVGGVVAGLWSYDQVFWLAIGFQMLAMLTMSVFVEEPRRRARSR
jgi:MFS family permease